MIARKSEFFRGLGLLIAFFVVLFAMFIPMFKEGTALNYMDNLYNSISKGSAYYIPGLQKDTGTLAGKTIEVTIDLANARQAEETSLLFEKAGAMVTRNDARITVAGDLAAILDNVLADADLMFHNKGEEVRTKYGYGERQVLFNWWTALGKMDFELKQQEKYDEAKFIGNVNQRAIECAYNYYEIVPEKIGNKAGIVIFSLVFYVIYTLWFGFAIMFMFEGWGLRLEH
ncbi:hypothetical protein [Desulfococcus sp.]|uniref:hypothetical protein n=1 Tax=Desulfococcus sp. TaxID=2025834 RepID=UPI003592EFD1